VSEAELVRTLSRHYGVPSVRLEGKRIEPEILALLTAEVAEEYRVIPLFKKRIGGGEVLYLGMAHPEDLRIVDDVSFRVGLPIRPVVVGPSSSAPRSPPSTGARVRGRFGPRGEQSVLAEMPVPDGDTAPLFNDLRPVVPHPRKRSRRSRRARSGMRRARSPRRKRRRFPASSRSRERSRPATSSTPSHSS
jgi:hypothetical protein